MIISASYRTDIPAFYADWFNRRLDAGYCTVRNPYSGKHNRVLLDAASVDAFVFWTRRLGPFMPTLERLQDQGTPFMVQYTVTGYPRPLESSVIDWRRAVDEIQAAAERHGPRAIVWRYDPVLLSSLTPPPSTLIKYHVSPNNSRVARMRWFFPSPMPIERPGAISSARPPSMALHGRIPTMTRNANSFCHSPRSRDAVTSFQPFALSLNWGRPGSTPLVASIPIDFLISLEGGSTSARKATGQAVFARNRGILARMTVVRTAVFTVMRSRTATPRNIATARIDPKAKR